MTNLIELAERLEKRANWFADNTPASDSDEMMLEAAAALRECARQEPMGYLDRYNVFYPKAVPEFYLRPVYAAPVPPIDREAILKAADGYAATSYRVGIDRIALGTADYEADKAARTRLLALLEWKK